MKEKTTSVFYYIEGASNKIDRQKILNSLQKKTKQEIWLNLHKKYRIREIKVKIENTLSERRTNDEIIPQGIKEIHNRTAQRSIEFLD